MSSVFSHHKTTADRSASDRRRHKQKIEKAIKDGIHDIVAEESIIGQDGKKKIKIPVKGIKEYKFVYGSNNSGVGAGGGHDIKRGQKIGNPNKKQKGKGKPEKPGDKAGEEYYDVEVTLEELAEYLFSDLSLPDLEKKAMKQIFSEKWKRKGHRPHGIRPRRKYLSTWAWTFPWYLAISLPSRRSWTLWKLPTRVSLSGSTKCWRSRRRTSLVKNSCALDARRWRRPASTMSCASSITRGTTASSATLIASSACRAKT